MNKIRNIFLSIIALLMITVFPVWAEVTETQSKQSTFTLEIKDNLINLQDVYTASGTYTYDSGIGILTVNITTSDFVCEGPQIGTEIFTVLSITKTEMIWQDSEGYQMTWTRDSGTPGDIVGTWTMVEDSETWVLIINSDGSFSISGEDSCVWTGSQHWPEGYYVNLCYSDPNLTATAVSVTGPGIIGSLALTSDPNQEWCTWNSWTPPSSSVFFGSTYPIPPLTYTFTITDASGTWTLTDTVNCFMEELPTNLSPSGTVTGTPTFSWTVFSEPYPPYANDVQYQVQLENSNHQRIWESQHLSYTTTSVIYDGPALTVGETYYYFVVAESMTSECSSFGRGSFVFVENALPIADPNGPYMGVEGQVITLDGSGSSDSDGSIVLYEWDINNDGIYDYSSLSPTQSHTYAQQGTYTIKLRVTDNLGATNEATTTATISDTSPIADFTGSPTSGMAPLTANFTNNSTGYDQPLTYEWDFDYNGTIDSTAQNPSYVYANSGIYTVKLAITDSDGSINTLIRTNYITVTPPTYFLTILKTGTSNGTVTSLPSGISCGADCAEAYSPGTEVTLTATPDVGSVFVGWSGGGCSGTGQCVVTISADTSVTATFDDNDIDNDGLPDDIDACNNSRAPGGLISYWGFEEGTGTIAYDSFGNNDGTIYGATWVEGKIGSALEFDGVDDTINIGDVPALNFERTDSFSVSAWVINYGGTTNRAIISKETEGRCNMGWSFGIDPSNRLKMRLMGAYDGPPFSLLDVRTNNTITSTPEWHHVVVTYNGSSKSSGINIYVNGVQESLFAVEGSNLLYTTIVFPSPANIGSRYTSSGFFGFSGAIDEMAIFNRVLSDLEIQEIYQNGLGNSGYCE